MKKEFIDHATRADKVETTAQLVGVVRSDDSYKKVSTYFPFLQLTFLNNRLFLHLKYMPSSELISQKIHRLNKRQIL
jgi:hypothetical protein